jgi:uncharacterized iron-regulated protein
MRLMLIVIVALLSGCQGLPPLPEWQSPEGREHAELGAIRDLRSGERIEPAELVRRLAAAERVLVGEKHDNPDHHALQRWLLEALVSRREQGSLLLEMLDPAQQANVDAVRTAGQLPKNLQEALDWQPGWDWSLYGSLLEYALWQPYPLLAANLTRDELMDAYRQRPDLADGAATTPAVRKALLAQIRESHCGKLPDSQLPAMLAVQQQRDRRMAEALLAAPEPAMLLAGAFHVRRDLGVPLHLADLGAGQGALVLLLAEVGSTVEAAQADFVWYTPALPEQDYCAAFGER